MNIWQIYQKWCDSRSTGRDEDVFFFSDHGIIKTFGSDAPRSAAAFPRLTIIGKGETAVAGCVAESASELRKALEAAGLNLILL